MFDTSFYLILQAPRGLVDNNAARWASWYICAPGAEGDEGNWVSDFFLAAEDSRLVWQQQRGSLFS